MDISITTAFYWRHKVLHALFKLGDGQKLTGILETDETYFLESYKGKRDLTLPHLAGRSHAAEVMLLAWKQCVDKYGYPCRRSGEVITQPEFVIIGYGKVGGLELSYSSDLDLVFLHNSDSMGSTNGDRSQDNGVFYTRMGQRMIHIISTQTRSGDLYEVDMRLRPSGNSGMIVASMKAFEEYQQQHAWTWEHQALVRARVLRGSEAAAEEFLSIRNHTLSQSRDLAPLREEVRAMRQKMRD